VVMALILLNLAGGEHVEDLGRLEEDEGFCRVLRKVEMAGLSRKVRRALERRWRRKRQRTVPSASAVFRYLAAFHEEEQEKLRQRGKAFIPAANEAFAGIREGEPRFGRVGPIEAAGAAGHPGYGCDAGGDPESGSIVWLATFQSLPTVEHLLGRAGAGLAYGVSRWQRAGRL
jgi:hypothetical protein